MLRASTLLVGAALLAACQQADGPAAAQARHALRRMDDFLRLCELEVQTMDGRPFDPGLAVRVIDTVDDPQPNHYVDDAIDVGAREPRRNGERGRCAPRHGQRPLARTPRPTHVDQFVHAVNASDGVG